MTAAASPPSPTSRAPASPCPRRPSGAAAAEGSPRPPPPWPRGPRRPPGHASPAPAPAAGRLQGDHILRGQHRHLHPLEEGGPNVAQHLVVHLVSVAAAIQPDEQCADDLHRVRVDLGDLPPGRRRPLDGAAQQLPDPIQIPGPDQQVQIRRRAVAGVEIDRRPSPPPATQLRSSRAVPVVEGAAVVSGSRLDDRIDTPSGTKLLSCEPKGPARRPSCPSL